MILPNIRMYTKAYEFLDTEGNPYRNKQINYYFKTLDCFGNIDKSWLEWRYFKSRKEAQLARIYYIKNKKLPPEPPARKFHRDLYDKPC